MPRVSFSNLTHSVLRRISPPILFELLNPHREFFIQAGYAAFPAQCPGRDEDAAFDCTAIHSLIHSVAHDCPEKLDEALYFINSVADGDHFDRLLFGAGKAKVELNLEDDSTAADIAVRVWMRAPRIIESLHAEEHIEKAATLTFFAPAKRLPQPADYRRLTTTDLDHLGRALGPWFQKRKRGNACRVFQFPRPDGIWFLLRHGDLLQRRAIYSLETNQESSARFRPQVHDSIIFRPDTGELGVCAGGFRLLRLYSRIMGRYLFGDDEYFHAAPKYTLEPLRRGAACLETKDVRSEVAWITLAKLSFAHPSSTTERVRIACSDVFAFFEQSRMPFPSADLYAATFRVQFASGGVPRDFSITSDTKARQLHDADHFALERFLMLRGFIVAKPELNDATTQLDLVAI